MAGGAFFIGCDSAKDLSPQTITITLDSNGGKIAENENWMISESNATKTIQISGDVAYYETLPDATTVTREGYEFLGWFTKIEGGENITATSQITNKSSHSIFAQWKLDETQKNDDYTGASFSISITIKVYTNGSLSTTGGSVTVNCSADEISQNGSYTTTSSSSTKRTSGVGHVYDDYSEATYDAPFTFTFNNKSGYEFSQAVFSTSNDGTVQENPYYTRFTVWGRGYSENDVIDSLTISVYFKSISYTLTLNGNGGTIPSGSAWTLVGVGVKAQKTVTVGSTYGALPTPTRNGYRFTNWTTSSSGGTVVTSSTKVTKTTAHSIYAQWQSTDTVYTITLDQNGGSGGTSVVYYNKTQNKFYSNSSCTGSALSKLTVPTRDDYDFQGYLYNSYQFTDGTGAFLTGSTAYSYITSNITAKASWKEVKTIGIVTLDKNGGSGGTSALYYVVGTNAYYTSSDCSGTAITYISTPTHSVYDFAGYYTDPVGGTMRITVAGNVSQMGAIYTMTGTTLYAHWSYRTYSITLNKNGGSGGTNYLYYQYGSTKLYITSSSNYVNSIVTPTRNGYDFAGYYLSQYPSSTSVAQIDSSGNIIENRSSICTNSNLTLYAKWTAKTISVTLNPGEGNGGTQKIYYKYGSSTFYSNYDCTTVLTGMKIELPSRTNFTFNGYVLSEDLDNGTAGMTYITSTGLISASISDAFYSSATLDATWVGNVFKVNLKQFTALTYDSSSARYNYTVSTNQVLYYRYMTPIFYIDSTCESAVVSVSMSTPSNMPYGSFKGVYTGIDGNCSGSYYVDGTKVNFDNSSIYSTFSRVIDANGTISGGDTICKVAQDHDLYAHYTPDNITITINTYDYDSKTLISGDDLVGFNYYLFYLSQYTSQLVCKGSTSAKSYEGSACSGSSATILDTWIKIFITSSGDGYKFMGLSTSASTLPTTTDKVIKPDGSNVYIWYKKLSSNKLMYDTVDKYFYFEDGYTLQTYVGSTLNTTLNNKFDPTSDTPAKTLSFYNGETKTTVNIYQYTDGKYYGAVKPSKSISIKLTNGSILSASAGSYYWFKYEPIRWRVSKYGVSSTSYPSGFTSANTTKTKFVVVSDKIVWATSMTKNKYELGAETTYDNTLYKSGDACGALKAEFKYSNETATYTSRVFGKENSQNFISNYRAYGVRVATEAEVKLYFADLRAKYTDFVAFVLGKDVDWGMYYTRDVGSKYYNMKAITAGGLEKDVWSNQFVGVRLAITFEEGSRWS